jgi:tetratricopeptide (TPR) repeat protein
VTYGLALALESQGYSLVGTSGGGRGTVAQLVQSAGLLRPLVYGSHPSRQVRQLYAQDLNILSHAQPAQTGVASCDEARKLLVGMGALDLSDLDATASYADVADSEARELLTLGRVTDAQKLEQQVYDLAEKVLTQRPGDLHAMADRSWAAELIGTLADRQHDAATAAEYANRTVQAGEDEVRFNPSDLGGWQRWTTGLRQVANQQLERGEVANAIVTMRSLLALENDKRLPSRLGPIVWFQWLDLANLQAQTGDSAAAAQSMKNFARDAGEMIAPLAADDTRRKLLVNPSQSLDAALQLAEGAPQAAFANASAVIDRIDAIKTPRGTSGYLLKRNLLGGMLSTASAAALRMGRYTQAESLARRWLVLPANPTSEADARDDTSRARTTLAQAIAMQGRNQEAQRILQPALAYYTSEQKAGADGITFRRDYAHALYVSAIVAPNDAAGHTQRMAALAQAATLIAGASTEARNLADMRHVSALIAATPLSPRG